MRPALLDTSVYISALRQGDGSVLKTRRLAANSPLWLSSVVLEELYAGTKPGNCGVVEKLEHDFDKANRLLVPNLSDWAETGKVLARLAAQFGYEQIGRARLTNDALIAMSASRRGITILTANGRDFARLALFRNFQWQLAA